MKSISIKVSGMHCDGCAATIEALVSAEDGVQAVSVTYKDSEARILFDPMRTSEDRLVALVQRPGYRVVGCRSP
jgi:copper chaperone CopZ